jgi:hypothetical protein
MIFAALVLVAFASFASAGIVDPEQSSATMNDSPAILLIAPGGADGLNFPDDHVIDVFVNDSSGEPVEIITSDLWLDNSDTEPCAGGWLADSSTFAPDAGHTTFSAILRGGVKFVAVCDQMTDVVALGNVIETVDLKFVSPDLNGDGVVGSVDFAIFAGCYNVPPAGHCFCADYNNDGAVGSTDFAIFASYYNVSECP